jgi:transcriptional regulator with XRE-family HTH domain
VERLRELRRAAGLSQEALAKKAGVTTSVLQCWERGRNAPRLAAAIRLAKALHCTLGQLAGTEPLPSAAVALGDTDTTVAVGAAVTLEQLETKHIRSILLCTSSLEEAAAVLGIDSSTLYRKRKRYGV